MITNIFIALPISLSFFVLASKGGAPLWASILVAIVATFGIIGLRQKTLIDSDDSDSQQDSENEPSFLRKRAKPMSKYVFWGLVIAVLLGAAGWVITEFDALDEKRARQEASEIRSQALQTVYSLENGEKIPKELVRYSARRQVFSILPGGARGEEIIDLDIAPGDEVFLKGEIVGDSWELNCAKPPIGRLVSCNSAGTSHGNNRFIRFKGDRTFSVRTQLVHGGKPGLTVGCPGYSEWIKLDYKIVEKRRLT